MFGEPEPEVKWFLNNKEIISTEHITLTYEKNITTLTITSVVVEDTGEYICKARNPLGEGITKTFLRVRRKSVVFDFSVRCPCMVKHSNLQQVLDWYRV